MQYVSLNGHQSIYWYPGIAEEWKLFNSVSNKDAACSSIDEDYSCEAMLLVTPAE